MKYEIDNLSVDQVEDFGGIQKDAIWGHAPSVDPNVLTPEEIMGIKEHPDAAVHKESQSKQYEDVSSSSDLSNAAQMVIEKMRAETKKSSQPKPEEAAFSAFKVKIEDTIDLVKTGEDVSKEDDEDQDVKIFEVEEPVVVSKKDDFKLELDFGDEVAEYEDVSSEIEPIEDSEEEFATKVLQIDRDQTFDAKSTNIFNTPITAPAVEEEQEQFEEEEEKIYNPKEDVFDSVQTYQSFASQRKSLIATGVLTGVIAFVMLCIALIQPWSIKDDIYYYVSGGLMAIAMLINYRIMASLATVFQKVPNSDCSPALAASFSFVQLLVCYLFRDSIGETFGFFSMFALAACVSMLFATLGKLSMIKRVLANLELLDKNDIHNATVFIAPPYSAKLADVQEIGETLICARRKSQDLKGFLYYSMALDPYETSYRKTLIISVVLAVLSGLFYGIAQTDVVSGVSLATAVFALFAPFATLIVNGLGMSSICKRLRVKGAVLSGYVAAEEISNANVIELEANELFDADSVNLYNFKTFEQYPFTQAIAEAASITQAVNSPLAGMFNKIVSTNKVPLYKVDNAEYEEKMGATGWLNEKKTIIGNRMIMESHNVPVPPIDFDKKIIQSGKFPVYLASDGCLTAVFIVGYSVKKQMVMRIRRLANTGVTILVRTTDPNISSDLICSKYGISNDSVVIMTSSAANYYQEITEQSEAESAMLIAKNARGFIDAYIQSIGAKQTVSLASVIMFIGCIIMSALAIVLSFIGCASFINSFTVSLIHLLGFGFIAFINILRS